jgi:hypothetical protein
MLAGTLGQAGYYMGEHLVPADEGNPKGYFEDDEINAINEELLYPVTPVAWQGRYGWRWFASIPLGTPLAASPALAGRMQAQTSRTPFCFKDPRFCYTLPAWRPFLPDTRCLCVFREPMRTARSIVKECQTADYLAGLPMDLGQALEVWTLMYRHVLEVHRHSGEWVFLHYDQLFQDSGLDRVQAALGMPVDRRFPDPGLKRSSAEGPLPSDTLRVYRDLCQLAGYDC